MPISFDEWKKSQDKRSSAGSAITGAVGGKPGGQSGGGSVSGSIVGAVQQQPTGQSGQSGGTMSFAEWQQQQEQSSGGSSGTVGGSILGGLGVQGGSQQPVTQGDLAAGQKLYEQRKQAQANADPWTPTFKWLGGIAQQAEQARNGLQVDPTETYSAWEDVKDAWEASRKANRAADYAGRDKLIKEYIAARHEMGAQRHTPEPEVQRRYEQARDRLYEQERIHGNIGLNANGELQTMSYSAGERVGNVIGGVIGRTIGHVGSAATWLGEAAARSEYAKSAAHQRELAAFYAMTGNDNASEGASRMADTLTQRAAQRENLAEFGGAYSFFDKQGRAGNRLVQAAKENQRPVVQMGVDVGSTALEMGFDAVSGSPLVSMGVRVFGGSSQEAREAGAGFLQQGAYGAASASIEVMTEMIGGLKLYGGGQLDEVLEPALREVAGTPGGYALLRAMYTMAQEGNEEVLSDLLQPLAQSIYNGQSVGENYSELQLKDILYDWLLGAASAFGGAVVESGGYAQDYTAMREMQQDLNAQGVETGRMTDEQLRQAYTLDKAGVNVAWLQSAENRAAGGETIGEAYDNMTQEQREAALVNMLTAQTQRSGQTQTPTDNITRETAQEILRESLGEREAESAERILDLGSESNLREQAIAYHTIATEYGQTEGRSVEDALRSNVRGALNDTQVQHAYAYGESLRKSGQTVGVNGQVTEQGAQTANPVRRAGLVTAGTFADGSTTYKAADLSKADARDLRILNDIAKAQGVDFVLYESELGEADAEGRRSYIGANGAYRNGVVYLDINAGLSGERTEGGKTYSIGQRALLVTAAHELTHHLEHSNPTMYRQLRSFVTERLGGSDSFIGYVKDAMAREDISVEAASREVVARACEEVLLDEDAIRELQGKKPTLWEQIKEWVKDFVKKFQSPSGEAVEMRQYADELRRLWLGAAKEVQESAGGTADVVFAEGAAKQTGSGADISHSLRENNNITARTMAYLGKHPAAHISAEMIETANGIINEMTDYMLPYLDKDNNLGRHYLPEEVLGTTIFSDSSYGKSVENTTICFRTLAYIDFTNEIKKRIGRPLTVQESFLASQMLYDIAKEPQCLYCYVSLDRKAYDEFLGKYLKQRDGVLKAFGELSSEEQTKIVEALRGIAPEEKGAAAVYARIPLYAEFLKDESGKKRKNTAPMRQRFGLWISAAAGGKGFITAKDLTTAETRNALKEGELAEQVLDAERYAQAASWAKKLEEYRAYNGNILNMSQETVDKLNESYGLRFYSFSEYSAAFIVENMQQIRDAAAKGLYGLAYTKKPDFARIFAGTGININISTFGRWGVDAQGKRVVVMDDLQGANWDEVKQLRDDFKNVGAVFVATDDAMVDWALAQDWIDVVIPFHIVRTGADVANFYKWVVHNQDQADKTKKGKAKDITPPEHQNDRATFLALAKERGLTPRFSKWLGNEHYMKLVNETRQPTKNSTPLKPVFDLKAAKQSFDDFVDEGGYYGNWYKEKTEQTGPVAYSYEEAVDQVVSDVKAGRKANEVSYGRQDIDVVAENFGKARQNAPRAHGQAMGPTVQRSVRDREYSEAVARGDMEAAQVLVNRAAMDAGVIANKSGRGPLHLYHGTPSFGFTEFRPGLIFLTDSSSIAAGYTANKGYGRVRRISEVYTPDDGTTKTLLKNIKNVLGRDYREANQSDAGEIADTMRKASDEMNDRVNAAWDGDAMEALTGILGNEYTDEVENKLYTILALPGSINENLNYMFENPGSPITEDIRRDLERWDDYRNDIRPLFVEHQKELTNSAAKGLRDLMIGFDLSDYLIDAQYSMLKALDIGNMLVAETGSLVSKNSMREAVEQAKDIGAYDLYALAGDNSLVVDGKGAFWTNIEVPELGGTFMTDEIGKLAKEKGYTSVQIKNIMDSSMNNYAFNVHSDVYIFFDSRQVKSADPVTYDDNGEVIPLSQRFDSGRDDIRFSVRSDAMTDREILMLAEAYGEGQTELAQFRDAMARYQDYDEAAQEHLQKLSELQTERKAVTDMRTSMGEITPQEKQQRLSALDEQIATERREATKAEQNAARALDRVTQLEKGRALQDILVKERAAQRQRTRAQVNERTRRRDTRRKVEKLAKELQKRVVTPSEKRYIPKDLMRQTVDVLQAINLDSGKPGTKSGEALRARLLELQDRYRQLETDETYQGATYDPIVAEMLQNMVKTVGDTPINKMSATQLESVYNTLRAMTHVIQTGVKVKLAGEERDAWEVAHDMTRETRSVNKPKDSLLNDWLNVQLSAARMFHRLGNYTKNSAWMKVYRMLNDGQLKMSLIEMEGAQIFAHLIGKGNEKAYRELNSYKEKDLVDVGLVDENGNSIKISHGMMVSLYMHLLNEQNASHVARGGLTIPELKGYYTGADDRGFGSGERRAVGVSAELAEARREQAEAETALREAKQSGDAEALQAAMDAADAAQEKIDEILAKGDAYVGSLRESIEKQLTDYEREWVKATQELMDDYSKGRLNETTLDVYGIKKARVENYYPIKSDKNFTRGNFEAVARDMSLENVGYMKERVGGTNPMYLMDIADVVSTQISNVAQYCGLMPAVRTFNKIWNKSEAGNTVSLKDTVNKKFGQGGLKYVENLIADLQGARRSKSDSLSRFLSGMRGNMAGANLTISLNTALAQAASYPTAASEIGWTPLIKAFFKGGQSGRMISRADRELIAKYTPLLWTRLQGYSTVELGDLAGNNQLAGRVFRKMRFITGWIQAMDTATVGRLWYAAQYYVDAKNPELQKGSDAYYKETAKVFNDIVEKTQPDYTTMQRPDILRHPNELVRSLTMFMTQRLQNFNIVYDAVATAQKYRQDYRNGQANGVTAEDVKQAQHEARRAVVSQIAAGATIVVFKTLSGILQHALDGYRDDDKELTEESISLACLDMFLDTMASNFLWGGELYDVIESAITGNRYYGLEVNGVQSISDILSTSQSLFSMLRDYKTLSWDKVQPKFITLAKKLGPALGLPIGNAVKLFKGIWLWGQEFIHAAEDSDMLKAFDFEEGVERGADIEANRYVSAWLDRDREKMREIIGGLGVSMTSFNSQLSSEIRERYEEGSINRAQAIRMLQELRGKTPEQAEKTVSEWKFKVDTGIDYDDIKEQLLNGSISVQRAAAYWQKYGGMSAEDATLKANYVAACGATPGLADKLSQTQYKGWYNNVRSAGVKVEVYAEIRSTASTDGNSNVSQAEAAAAITRAINARQLTPAQAQAVWQSFSSSWKTTYAEYIAQNK